MFALIPLVGFTWIWILLTNENNADNRFQYVAFAIGVMSVPLILRAARGNANERNWGIPVPMPTLWVLAGCALVMSVLWWRLMFPAVDTGSGEYNIATGLAKWKDRGYTLTTTEAGVIPYFSGWRSIDAYGLNDSEIVHNPKGLTEDYLSKNNPAVMIIHLSTGGLSQQEFEAVWKSDAPVQHDLAHQAQVASHFAATHNYTLAARWGEWPCSLIIDDVRNDLPEFPR